MSLPAAFLRVRYLTFWEIRIHADRNHRPSHLINVVEPEHHSKIALRYGVYVFFRSCHEFQKFLFFLL